MPRMFLLEPQHLSRLPIAQRALVLAHLPRNRRIRLRLLQILHRRHLQRRSRVRGIEDLEAQPALLYA